MPADRPLPWPTAWRLARRELTVRFRGLRLLMLCLFLGVAALAAVGALGHAIAGALAANGRTMLGGDVELAVWARPLTAPERAALAAYGQVSEGTRMQAMAQAVAPAGPADRARADTADAVPVQLKAVDRRWPLVGRLTLADGRKVGAPPPDTAWLSDGAAARLGVATGAHITLSGAPVTVGGIIADEPDRLGEGFALGPTVIVPAALPLAAGLESPGAMFRTRARLACLNQCDPARIATALKQRFPAGGAEIRTPADAAEWTGGFVARMADFLTLVGLAALLIAGLGIAGGTASYLETRRGGIAALKVLGATGGDIARIYVLQIGAAAALASLAGTIAGALAVPLIAQALKGLLPIPDGTLAMAFGAPLALGRALAFGILTALVFAAPALADARRWPAMALLRARVDAPRIPWRTLALPVGGGLVLLVALALAGGGPWRINAEFLAGAAAVFALLAGLGGAIRWAARRLGHSRLAPRAPIAALALANLHRPGAQTARLVTALGFGLATFVLLAVVQTGLGAEIDARIPRKAPDYFAIDLPPQDLPGFTARVTRIAPGATVRAIPMLRAAILAYGPPAHMTQVADLKTLPEGAWALKGERGITFATDIPEGNAITAGRWWAPNDPRAQVSVDEALAQTIHLRLGDSLTIGLLGVERTATVTSLRKIGWGSFGFNNVLVFSPAALAGAPYKLAASVRLSEASTPPCVDPRHPSDPPARTALAADLARPGRGSGPGPQAAGGCPGRTVKDSLLRMFVRAYPQTSVIETGPILRDARHLLQDISIAIFAAAAVTVLAGLAVLFGAIAAARAARAYDTVILRVLGAGNRQIAILVLAEFAGLALILAVVALLLGAGLGWLILVPLFGFDFLPDWPRVGLVLAGGLVLVVGFAFAASLPLLRVRPAAALREL